MSKGDAPFLRMTILFTLCFLSPFLFTLFSFAWSAPCCRSHRQQGVSLGKNMRMDKRNKSFTGRSKTVHILCVDTRYTKFVSKGSRNPKLNSLPIFYFSFTPFFKSV